MQRHRLRGFLTAAAVSKLQVLRAVVISYTVEVMDGLAWEQMPVEQLGSIPATSTKRSNGP